jgi:uncharacterized zinc-type alcohol dehydrogenase-like protein
MPDATPRDAASTKTQTFPAHAFAADSASAPLAPATIARRTPGPRDVQIEILFCGVCHSDLHQARNEWENAMPTVYPCVPGHEIVGRAVAVGSDVTSFQEGDLVAVGCLVDSCRSCAACTAGDEHYCESLPTFTYNGEDPHLGGVTYGGYSDSIVVDQDYVLKVPAGLDLASTAPLLCAGITTYSPLRHWKVGKGHRVGVVGLGGLGHMAVKIANALGAHVIVFTTSPGKTDDALRLGAKEVVVSKRPEEMEKHLGSLDFILDTVSAVHEVNPYLELLKRDGTMTMLGAPMEPLPVGVFSLLFGRRRLSGSLIGGIRETQEMLDFCAEHGITSDIELIPISKINEAFERLLKGDVKYRFVIDMASLRSPA